MSFNVCVITAYPEMFPGPLGYSNTKKALDKNIWNLKIIDLKDFGIGKHKKIDDEIFGGGCGLLIKPDVLSKAIDFAFESGASKNLVYLSPHGEPLKQKTAKNLILENGITIICGHFEGIDYRIIDKYKPKEISIGDFITSGGEIPALILIDTCLRLINGVINSSESLKEESFENGLLEYPQYTRPSNFEGLMVPDVLLSGNHQEIKNWRLKKSQELTKEKREDLFLEFLNIKEQKVNE